MRIFLSWSGAISRQAASDFRDFLQDALRWPELDVYFSPTSNPPGLPWRDIIRDAIAGANVAVLFLTRDAIRSPWVLFEAGGIGKVAGSLHFVVPIGIERAEIPQALEQFQSAEFSQTGFELIIEQLAKAYRRQVAKNVDDVAAKTALAAWWSRYAMRIRNALSVTLDGKNGWRSVTPASVSPTISGSPFEAKHILAVAKHSIDLVAQNHFFIAVERFDEMTDLFKVFLSDASHEVNILAMNPANTGAVRAWTDLMDRPHFSNDLDRAIKGLKKWITMRKGWKGKFNVFLTGLIPTSQTFYDADHDEGGMVMIPMFNQTNNVNRPAIWITKRQSRSAFDAYLAAYIERRRRAVVLTP